MKYRICAHDVSLAAFGRTDEISFEMCGNRVDDFDKAIRESIESVLVHQKSIRLVDVDHGSLTLEVSTDEGCHEFESADGLVSTLVNVSRCVSATLLIEGKPHSDIFDVCSFGLVDIEPVDA